jgi:polyhydroxyalkanoate synthesis regulator phasin
MGDKKPFERYMEAGKEFTETSRKRIEKVAHDLAREGEAGREHAEDWAEEFVQRGRKTAEQLADLVRKEIRAQIKQFNLATNQDVVKVVQQFIERTTKAAAPVMEAAGRKVTATKSSATAKSHSAKKPAPAKTPAPAKKAAPTKKAAAAKAPAVAKPAATKKSTPAKKAPATKKSQASSS